MGKCTVYPVCRLESWWEEGWTACNDFAYFIISHFSRKSQVCITPKLNILNPGFEVVWFVLERGIVLSDLSQFTNFSQTLNQKDT